MIAELGIQRSIMLFIDEELWRLTRAGARAGRGFRYQDAVVAWLTAECWAGNVPWNVVIPEGVEDITLHGEDTEYRLELKSRHNPQGTFDLNELAAILAKMACKLRPQDLCKTVHLAVVLERSAETLSSTGWITSLSDSCQDTSRLRGALSEQLPKEASISASEILSRAHLIVEGNPLERFVNLLEARSSITPFIARLVAHDLRSVAGHCADDNYLSSAISPKELSASSVQERIETFQTMIDATTAEDAIRLGLCESVAWHPISTQGFYSGVDVVPGHITAGLVFERPKLTSSVLEALQQRHVALIAGPSGSGKSAAAWLSAYATRHAVRWYRIKLLTQTDVHLIARLANAVEASEDRPVGFVLDDVGRQFQNVWDGLVRELSFLEGVILLGTVREEDIYTLDTAVSCPVIRPELEEELAKNIWKALSCGGTPKFGHWREPMEKSRGLLLEFTHLLTQGQRLEETISEQVRRRHVEGRDDELLILRPVAFAAAHGCAVDSVRLMTTLGFDELRFTRSLKRLIDEHAVKELVDGALSGLHEIRSAHLSSAMMCVFMSKESDEIAEVVTALRSSDLALFVHRILKSSPDFESFLLDPLCLRLSEGEPKAWISVIHGLALASEERLAAEWLKAFRAYSLPDRFAAFAFNFALADTDLSSLPNFEKVNEVIAYFKTLSFRDFRSELGARLPNEPSIPPCTISELNELAAAFLPIPCCSPPPKFTLKIENEISKQPLESILDTARTLHEVHVDHAKKFIELAGGTDNLLERIYIEIPWVTRPSVRTYDGATRVEANVRYVVPEFQPDIHGDVVRLCELLLSAVPHADLAVCMAVDATGAASGLGDYEIASKQLNRKAVPPPAIIARNRAILRSIQHLIGSENQTQRLIDLQNAIKELVVMLAEATEVFCRMEKPKADFVPRLNLRNLLTELVPPSCPSDGVSGPLELGEYIVNDEVFEFASDLQSFIKRLLEDHAERPVLLAISAEKLIRSAEKLREKPYWWWIGEPPESELSLCVENLESLRDVFGVCGASPHFSRSMFLKAARSSKRRPALQGVTISVREYANTITNDLCSELQLAFTARGINAVIVSRPMEVDKGTFWPPVELAALIEVESLEQWLASSSVIGDVFEEAKQISCYVAAPVRWNKVVGDLACSYRASLLPDVNFAQNWKDYLPIPLVTPNSAASFGHAIDALNTLSAIILEKGRPLNEKEGKIYEAIFENLAGFLDQFLTLVKEASTEPNLRSLDALRNFLERVENERDDDCSPDTSPFAHEIAELVRGKPSQAAMEVIFCRLLLLEQDAAA